MSDMPVKYLLKARLSIGSDNTSDLNICNEEHDTLPEILYLIDHYD